MDPHNTTAKRKAVIIGAGPAGLTAAHELLSRAGETWEVTILEEADAIGGISRTVEHNGNRMDLGGHRFFSKSKRINDWWAERMPLQGSKAYDDLVLGRDCLLVEGGPDPQTEDQVMLARHRVSRIYYDHRFFDYPVSLTAKTLRAMGPLATLAVGGSYVHAALHRLPETSLENYYINRFGRRLYSMFFEGYTEKLWGRHPRDLSADWGAQRVKGLSLVATVKDALAKAAGRKNAGNTETSLIEQFFYPKLGVGQLWEQVAHEIRAMGGHIMTGVRAATINVDDSGAIRSVESADGQNWNCDVLMSSMPVKDLVHALTDATDEASAIARGLPYRDFISVGVLVAQLALKNETDIRTLGNIVPDNWIYVQDSSVKLGRIQVFNNWSPYLVADPVKTVWLGLEYFCSEGDAFWSMDEAERLSLVQRELVSMGVLDEETPILDSHVERVRKAYPAYFGTYERMDELIAWLDTHPNLYCLGRNGQHRYNNMDHSMLTAFNAVDVLLSGSDDRSRVWKVNTESTYHEEH